MISRHSMEQTKWGLISSCCGLEKNFAYLQRGICDVKPWKNRKPGLHKDLMTASMCVSRLPLNTDSEGLTESLKLKLEKEKILFGGERVSLHPCSPWLEWLWLLSGQSFKLDSVEWLLGVALSLAMGRQLITHVAFMSHCFDKMMSCCCAHHYQWFTLTSHLHHK